MIWRDLKAELAYFSVKVRQNKMVVLSAIIADELSRDPFNLTDEEKVWMTGQLRKSTSD